MMMHPLKVGLICFISGCIFVGCCMEVCVSHPITISSAPSRCRVLSMSSLLHMRLGSTVYAHNSSGM